MSGCVAASAASKFGEHGAVRAPQRSRVIASRRLDVDVSHDLGQRFLVEKSRPDLASRSEANEQRTDRLVHLSPGLSPTRHHVRRRGSSASRRPSPNWLIARTVSMMATSGARGKPPGHAQILPPVADHGPPFRRWGLSAETEKAQPSGTENCGGISSVARTMTGVRMFGMMWRNISLRAPHPATCEAVTYSCSRAVSTDPRTNRV